MDEATTLTALSLAEIAGEWEEAPDDIEVRPTLGTVISLRLDAQAARAIRRAAKADGVTQSRFVRDAAYAHATSVLSAASGRLRLDAQTPVRISLVDDKWRAVPSENEPNNPGTTVVRDWTLAPIRPRIAAQGDRSKVDSPRASQLRTQRRARG